MKIENTHLCEATYPNDRVKPNNMNYFYAYGKTLIVQTLCGKTFSEKTIKLFCSLARKFMVKGFT
jgi:hypothetical protein